MKPFINIKKSTFFLKIGWNFSSFFGGRELKWGRGRKLSYLPQVQFGYGTALSSSTGLVTAARAEAKTSLALVSCWVSTSTPVHYNLSIFRASHKKVTSPLQEFSLVKIMKKKIPISPILKWLLQGHFFSINSVISKHDTVGIRIMNIWIIN